MRRSFMISLIAVFLSACAPTKQDIKILPTFIQTPTIVPEIELTATSRSGLSPHTGQSNPILTEFPLSVGAYWKFSGEIIYQNPKDYERTETWSGYMTDLVVEQYTNPDGNAVFTMQEILEPTPTEGVWRQTGTRKYLVSENEILADDIKIFQWPLADHLSWEAIAGTGYEMNVTYIGETDTPYGKLEGCYTLLLATLPDASLDTFCPGVGFVEHKYQHYGDRQDEHFILVSYEPGQ